MTKLLTTLSSVAIAVVLTGCGAAANNPPSTGTNAPASTSSSSSSTSKYISYDASSKTANLTLNAGVSGGFDFNGYTKGAMTVTIPQGWTVNVTFTNQATVNHSAEIVPFSQVKAGKNFTPAFSGAAISNPTLGISQGVTKKFSFTADKAGKYGIICAVPGHDDAGMWDTLVVSSSASTPSISTQ